MSNVLFIYFYVTVLYKYVEKRHKNQKYTDT